MDRDEFDQAHSDLSQLIMEYQDRQDAIYEGDDWEDMDECEDEDEEEEEEEEEKEEEEAEEKE